jgi:hypothetical protein
MAAVDWDSVPVAEPPPGAVEVPADGWGFLTVATILELGVPDVLYRLPHDSPARDAGIAAYLDAADVTPPDEPLAHCWFIVPPPSMPTEGFWEALDEAAAVVAAGSDPIARRHGLRDALRVFYSNS